MQVLIDNFKITADDMVFSSDSEKSLNGLITIVAENLNNCRIKISQFLSLLRNDIISNTIIVILILQQLCPVNGLWTIKLGECPLGQR